MAGGHWWRGVGDSGSPAADENRRPARRNRRRPGLVGLEGPGRLVQGAPTGSGVSSNRGSDSRMSSSRRAPNRFRQATPPRGHQPWAPGCDGVPRRGGMERAGGEGRREIPTFLCGLCGLCVQIVTGSDRMLQTLRVPLSWTELARRTYREAVADNCLGLAAQLAYYFFLALFPALLFFVALISFIPVAGLLKSITDMLGRVAPTEVLTLVSDQIVKIAEN